MLRLTKESSFPGQPDYCERCSGRVEIAAPAAADAVSSDASNAAPRRQACAQRADATCVHLHVHVPVLVHEHASALSPSTNVRAHITSTDMPAQPHMYMYMHRHAHTHTSCTCLSIIITRCISRAQLPQIFCTSAGLVRNTHL